MKFHRTFFAIFIFSLAMASEISALGKKDKAESGASSENQKEYISRAATGLTLPPEKKYGEQKALPATLIFEAPAICKITVLEGKFHEVRRIFRALGNEVSELERFAIGKLELPPDLKAGQWRPLTDDEKELLMLL